MQLSKARAGYQQFVRAGISLGRRKDLSEGGLIRSQGGWVAVKEQRSNGKHQKGDERILGDGDFVEQVLKKAGEEPTRKHLLQAKDFDADSMTERIASLLQISREEVLAEGKKRMTVVARSLFCFWMSRESGVSQAELARQLNLSQPAVSLAVDRGRKLVEERQYRLIE